MAEEKLDIIKKAIELFDRTLTNTSSRKKYPAKYRKLVDKTQDKSMEIYECLMEANRKKLSDEREERIKLQTRAITCCDQLNLYIEIAMNHNLISSSCCETWSKISCDIKHMAIAWRTKDKQR